jgi:hypothetical protein
MSALPAHTRNYFTQANQPFGSNNTTQLLLEQYYTWCLHANILGIAPGGTTSGSRVSTSVWIMRGSSNGTSADAVTATGVTAAHNYWGGATFSAANFVRGSGGAAHSWALFENTTLGYELLINFSATAGYLGGGIAHTGTFTVGSGSPTAHPIATAASVVCLGQNTFDTTSGGQYPIFGDTSVTGAVNYFHFTCADTGEFHCEMSHATEGCFSSFIGVWASTGAQAGDNNNMFLLSGDTAATGRGVWAVSRYGNSAACASRQPSGVQKSGGGIVVPYYGASSSVVAGQGVDSISSNYLAAPVDIIEVSPVYVRRGTLPDLYIVGTAPVGGSIPNTTSQIRTVIGDMIFPFISVVPLL